VLYDVLGFLAGAEHVAAEGEDAGTVALKRNLEGGLVPAPDLVDEPIVARERQKPLGTGQAPSA